MVLEDQTGRFQGNLPTCCVCSTPLDGQCSCKLSCYGTRVEQEPAPVLSDHWERVREDWRRTLLNCSIRPGRDFLAGFAREAFSSGTQKPTSSQKERLN